MTRLFRILALIALVGLGGAAVASVGHAGLLDSVKKKVTDSATHKATESADKAMAKPAATESGTAKADDAKKSEPAADGGMVSSVSSKFDFVPGDRVLFADDFTQDELGEFPARWKLLGGTFEVAEMNGERWLRSLSAGSVRMKVPPSLPEFWTLEFDGYSLEDGGNALDVVAQAADGTEVWEAVFPMSGRNLHFASGSIVSDTPFEGEIAGRHHIMFMARGTNLKAYVDRDRMASVPDVTEHGTAVQLEIKLQSVNKPMITHVRFAEGCKPAKDALDTGKLVTYGIRFDTGSDIVLPESAPVLRQVSGYMGQHPDVKLRIVGHTDNVGTAASNLDLSKRRAASVAKILADQFGVDAGRFTTDGRGDTQAIASNATPEGRAMNRRVEFAKQ